MTPRVLVLISVLALGAAGCGSETTTQGASEEAPPAGNEVAATQIPEPAPSIGLDPPPEVSAPATAEHQRTCSERSAGTTAYPLAVGGTVYEVTAHVPRALDHEELAPVVLNWHGVGGTGPGHTLATGYDELAELEGFIVISPTGPPLGDSGTNAWELAGFESASRDDVAFAEALIDDAVTRFCGDSRRVYSVGMSNGGLFTSRLVCELSDRLAAAAAVGGVIHDDSCQPARAVPFMAFHGTADDVVPFDGAVTQSVFDHPIAAAFEGLAMAEEFAQFAADMGCAPVPEVVEIPPDVLRHDYLDCDAGATLVFHEIVGGGHTWPGLWDATGTVDATAGTWAFFEQYEL